MHGEVIGTTQRKEHQDVEQMEGQSVIDDHLEYKTAKGKGHVKSNMHRAEGFARW